MTSLIDTHAHLDFPDFTQDLESVLERAKQVGVKKIISIGTCLESSLAALQLADRYPEVYAAVGIHPCNVEEESADALTKLEPLLSHPKVAALGECGLDYHHLPSRLDQESDLDYSARWQTLKEKQASFFRKQLELAASHHLNVVVHQRDSWDDTLTLLQPFSHQLKAVFHCFGGSPAQAQEIIAMGHLVSFTGIVTFKNAVLVRESIRSLTSGTFMVETDCPYLAPVPHRGKRCEPSHVELVAETIGQVRQQTQENLRAELWQTTHAFFRLE